MEKSVSKPRTGTAIQSQKVVERRSRIRDGLLSTGARLFAEKGIDAVSVEEIIESVGIYDALFTDSSRANMSWPAAFCSRC